MKTKKRSSRRCTHKHKKDFNWKEKTTNPFHIPEEQSPLRQKMLLIVGAVAVLSTIGLLLYHPFFQISHITVHGLVRVGEEDFLNATRSSIHGNKWIVIPRSNYFFLDAEDMGAVLQERYVLEYISIIEHFPSSIDIAIQEKISTIIYDNGETYSYMGIDGKIVEEIRIVDPDEWFVEYGAATTTLSDGSVTTTEQITRTWHVPASQKVHIEMGDFPIVYDQTYNVDEDNQLSKEAVTVLLEMHNTLRAQYNINTTYIRIPDNVSATYLTDSGGAIFISLDGSTADYIQTLEQLAYSVDIAAAKEVDLRFGERVYVR
jgi:cell division septal protein FtsQ